MEDVNTSDVVKEGIEAILLEKVIPITMPVNVLVREAIDMSRCARVDIKALTGINYTIEKVVDVELRAKACQDAESLWLEENHCANTAEESWAVLRDEVNEAKFETIHTFKYAYRDDANVLAALAAVSEGASHADALQDLSDLVVIGKKHSEPLEAINYDLTKLDALAKLGQDASDALAIANEHRLRGSEAKVYRDKAYTYLKEGFDELRAAGKFLFHKNPKKLKGYVSRYWKKKNAVSRKDDAEVSE
eukprot:TRINITY_DN617_c4_g1_i1.p1 TRINITY_DN617_c4_g1~~TRINITY_DN617_c4_g1_i1.p1  ORF type:complete len:248 (-),score=21.47 TRINITY_DN617_c4_g1_i1:170-913(-)